MQNLANREINSDGLGEASGAESPMAPHQDARLIALRYANAGSGREFRDADASWAGRRSVANGVSPNRPR